MRLRLYFSDDDITSLPITIVRTHNKMHVMAVILWRRCKQFVDGFLDSGSSSLPGRVTSEQSMQDENDQNMTKQNTHQTKTTKLMFKKRRQDVKPRYK